MPIRKIRDYYFTDKNYLMIYLHRVSFRIGNQIISVFAASYLYLLGFSIPQIILYYAGVYLIQGTSSILGNGLLKTLGPPRGVIISLVFFSISYFCMAQVHQHTIWILPTMLANAIASGIYFSFADVMEGMFIAYDRNRGKQFTLTMIMSSIFGSLGVAFTAYILSVSSYIYVAIFATICLIISAIPLFIMKPVKDVVHHHHTMRVVGLMRSRPFRPYIPAFFGEQLVLITRAIFVPLFIFILVGKKFDAFGYLLVAATLVEIVITLFMGHQIDQHGSHAALKKSLWMTTLTSTLYIFFVTTPFSAFCVEVLSRLSWNTFMSSFRTGMHKHARKKFELLTFGAAWQATLCYSEALVLCMLAPLAYVMGTHIFVVVFLGSILGVYIGRKYLHQIPQHTHWHD